MVFLAVCYVLFSGLYSSTVSYDGCKEANWKPEVACKGPKLLHDLGKKTCSHPKLFDGKKCK